MKDYLDKDQWALYKLIWDRFVASQMASAVFLQTTVEIKADDAIFTAVGTIPTFQGFMTLYVEGEDNIVLREQGRGDEKAITGFVGRRDFGTIGPPPQAAFHPTPSPFLRSNVD